MIIAIANHKGGVGKSTIAVALATRMAEQHSVLLIDLDSQYSATQILGVDPRPGVYNWLVRGSTWGVTFLDNELCLLPGHISTEFITGRFGVVGNIKIIEEGLAKLKRSYQFIILDCPPSMSLLTRAAVYASDYAFVPTLAQKLSVEGVRKVVSLLTQLQQQWQVRVRLLGIQPNKVDRRTRDHRRNLDRLYSLYGHYLQDGFVWPSLRQAIAIAWAATRKRSIWQVLRGPVREEWEHMCDEVIKYGV